MIFRLENNFLVKLELKSMPPKLNLLIDAIKYSIQVLQLEGYQDIIQIFDTVELEAHNFSSNTLETKFKINLEIDTRDDLLKCEIEDLSKKILSECIIFNNLLFEDELLELKYPKDNIINLSKIFIEILKN